MTKINPKIQVEIFGQNFTSFTGTLQAAEQVELAHQAAGLSLDPTQSVVGTAIFHEPNTMPSPIQPPAKQQVNQP